LPSSGVPTLDGILGGKGYPERSAILIIGPPGINKEDFGYWFAKSGLLDGDSCLYLTRLSKREVEEDEGAFETTTSSGSLVWLAREGGEIKLDINDLSSLLDQVRGLLGRSGSRRVRIIADILSSVLMLNSPETAYRFVDRLIVEVKAHDAVLLATMEEGMHPIQIQVAMQQLFDGFIELSLYKAGLKILPLLRVGKMKGANPDQEYYTFSFARTGIQLKRAFLGDDVQLGPYVPAAEVSAHLEPARGPILTGPDAKVVFDFLVKSFIADYAASKLAIEQSGWRTRVTISKATGVPRASFYGEGGRFGPIMKELLSSGLVETRFFPGQRGRGGEVIKVRIAYEKELVKRLVDNSSRDAGGGN